ncbi:MAG: flagellar hook-associated protein FlgL [Dehalococcoidia bacterium]
MRVSEQTRQTARTVSIQTATERLDRVQQQLATGRRISNVSEDPAAASIALGHRNSLGFEAQMRRNLTGGVAFIDASEAALASVTDALQRVRELTVQASSGTVSTSDRTAIAQEVNQLIGQIAQLANSDFAGAYVFAGHRSDQPAYIVTGTPPATVTYQGDAGQRVRRISRQDATAVNVTGPAVFGTVFTDLIALRDNLNASVPPSVIAPSIATIDAALERVVSARADLGSRANRFDAAFSVSERTDVDLQKLRADVEEVDITAAISQFTAAQQALEAALGAVGRTSSMSLLNFLR